MKRYFSRVLLALVVVTFAACSGAQKRADRHLFEVPSPHASDALSKWFAGEEEAAEEVFEPLKAVTTEDLFFDAEFAYWRGDVERSFDKHVEVLRRDPDHDLARYSAAHLYALRNTVIDFERRVQPALQTLDYARLSPLARLYVSMTAQTVGFRMWERSDTNEPFDASVYGFPQVWLTTPLMSPWRLEELDDSFPPEEQERLEESYLSPQVAKETEVNYEYTQPYRSSGISLYPSFSRNGIHYLETFATVPTGRDRDYWLYGNFVSAARVWIDGELVMSRDEGDYGPGKRLRKIRLTPGTHRVLVKMAYQSGYREWFDMNFIPAGRHAVNEAEITFAYACLPGRELPGCRDRGADADAAVELLTDSRPPVDFESVLATPEQVGEASDVALYLTMLGAYFDGETEIFEAAWKELSERRPKFAAGHAMKSGQVQTLWEMPSRLRDAKALQALRTAHELDPDSVRYLESLGSWLKNRDGEREVREILERARDLTVVERGNQPPYVRDIGPLNAWADWLGDQGWEEQAEKAWTRALELAPSNCRAAEELQSIYRSRNFYPKPEEITPEHERCPDLRESWLSNRDDLVEAKLELARRKAERRPLRASRQRQLARELYRQGKPEEGKRVLRTALRRIPDSLSLWNELAERELAEHGKEAAVRVYREAIERNGNRSWLVWKLATLDEEIPLEGLMPDGYEAATDAVNASKDLGGEKSLSKDEAYYVVDFAARRYFPDMSSITLTHTVVRVMTKDAIDRYGETSIPGDARVLLARTIKQDGRILVPDQTAGKSTLSMPGLAEGDFLEIAYLQYDRHKVPASHIEGVRFYFRMKNISTLHSEYVILGEQANFIQLNDAPEKEEFTFDGVPAVRFLAKNNPRPRREPRAVSGDEYLPWIQMYRNGTTVGDFEYDRRDRYEQIADSMKMSVAFEEQVREWLDTGEQLEKGSRAHVKELFYRIGSFFPDPSMNSFGTDVSHAVLTKEGNPLLVLKAVYDATDIPADIYLVKSKYQQPDPLPIREFSRYRHPLLRVTIPKTDEVVWLHPDGPDAMFAAVGPALAGQPAVCVTCTKDHREMTKQEAFRNNEQALSVSGKLDADGNLTGTMEFVFDGAIAEEIRRGLRSRTDETRRLKLMDRMTSGAIASSSVDSYVIEGEKEPDEKLKLKVTFRRPSFARETMPGVYQIETRLFREAVASQFAPLSERTTPLMVGFHRANDYRLEIDVSAFDEAQLMSRAGTLDLKAPFGTYARTTEVADGKLVVDSSFRMPIQRVPVTDYADFQQWAIAVEQSSVLFLTLR